MWGLRGSLCAPNAPHCRQSHIWGWTSLTERSGALFGSWYHGGDGHKTTTGWVGGGQFQSLGWVRFYLKWGCHPLWQWTQCWVSDKWSPTSDQFVHITINLHPKYLCGVKGDDRIFCQIPDKKGLTSQACDLQLFWPEYFRPWHFSHLRQARLPLLRAWGLAWVSNVREGEGMTSSSLPLPCSVLAHPTPL